MEISRETLYLLADTGDVKAREARQYYHILRCTPALRGQKITITATSTGYKVDAQRKTGTFNFSSPSSFIAR